MDIINNKERKEEKKNIDSKSNCVNSHGYHKGLGVGFIMMFGILVITLGFSIISTVTPYSISIFDALTAWATTDGDGDDEGSEDNGDEPAAEEEPPAEEEPTPTEPTIVEEPTTQELCPEGTTGKPPNCDPIPPEPAISEVFCDDGIDNDGDGLVDGEDPDCARFPTMKSPLTTGTENQTRDQIPTEDEIINTTSVITRDPITNEIQSIEGSLAGVESALVDEVRLSNLNATEKTAALGEIPGLISSINRTATPEQPPEESPQAFKVKFCVPVKWDKIGLDTEVCPEITFGGKDNDDDPDDPEDPKDTPGCPPGEVRDILTDACVPSDDDDDEDDEEPGDEDETKPPEETTEPE